MNMNNWKEKAFAGLMIGFTQFLVITAILMVIYPGGTYYDPNTKGYNFFLNYFSDIGRTVTHGGHPNMISSILFTISLSIVGTFFCIFCVLVVPYFKDNTFNKNLCLVASFLGILSGISFIVVACAPSDTQHLIHIIFVRAGSLFGFLSIFVYTIIMFRDESFTRLYAFSFLIFTLTTLIYLLLLLFGPSSNTLMGNMIQATSQKIAAYTMIISLLIQCYGLWRREKLS